MTKASIIQRLLDEKLITVDEAMILMSQNPMPQNPYQPYSPPYHVGDWPGDKTLPNYPIWYTSDSGTGFSFDNEQKFEE